MTAQKLKKEIELNQITKLELNTYNVPSSFLKTKSESEWLIDALNQNSSITNIIINGNFN